LKEQYEAVINEIETSLNATKDGNPYFSEDEKKEVMESIREIKLDKIDEDDLSDLIEFKTILSEELAKRESKMAT